MVVNIAFILIVYIHHFYPGMIGIWKNSKIKANILKIEGLVKRQISYMKHIKIQWCHMDVIFMTKHLIWQMLQCVHIPSLIMHCRTGNGYCGAVMTFHVSIFLTKKQIISIQKQHPQFGFTFITSLHVVVIMVELHWRTIKYVTCVNNNIHKMNLQKYTSEKN